jgi:hypothetical protein
VAISPDRVYAGRTLDARRLALLSTLRARLTYANVMATVAVFVALGGSSYAAIKVTGRNVPRDALTGADIKNLTGADVRNNSLTGVDVKNLGSGDVANGRLLAEDFAPGQLPQGERGPQGVQGQQGPPGQPGAPGSAVAYAKLKSDLTLDATRSKNVASITKGSLLGTPQTGKWCVDATVPVNHVVATLADGFPGEISADLDSLFLCPAGADALVEIWTSAGDATDSAFWVLFN